MRWPAAFVAASVVGACGRLSFDAVDPGPVPDDGAPGGAIDAARVDADRPDALPPRRPLDPSWTPAYGSLVGYWPLDGVGALSSGSSVSARVGPMGLAANPSGTGLGHVPGQLDEALAFDGSDDFVTVATEPELQFGATASFTLASWIAPIDADQRGPILTKRADNSPFTQYAMMICGPNVTTCPPGRRLLVAIFQSYPGGAYRGGYTDADLADGAWHHVVVVVDGGAQALAVYVDGAPAAFTLSESNGGWPNTASTQPLRFGNNNGALFYQGTIDEVAIWATALTAGEVATIYGAQVGP